MQNAVFLHELRRALYRLDRNALIVKRQHRRAYNDGKHQNGKRKANGDAPPRNQKAAEAQNREKHAHRKKHAAKIRNVVAENRKCNRF